MFESLDALTTSRIYYLTARPAISIDSIMSAKLSIRDLFSLSRIFPLKSEYPCNHVIALSQVISIWRRWKNLCISSAEEHIVRLMDGFHQEAKGSSQTSSKRIAAFRCDESVRDWDGIGWYGTCVCASLSCHILLKTSLKRRRRAGVAVLVRLRAGLWSDSAGLINRTIIDFKEDHLKGSRWHFHLDMIYPCSHIHGRTQRTFINDTLFYTLFVM